MSIVFLLNEKFRERIEVWKVFETDSENFSLLFNEVMLKCLEKIDIVKATPAIIREQTALLVFLNHCFSSMEVELCREQAKKLVSLSMWSCLQPKRRDQELNSIPEWKKFWKKLQKRDKQDQKDKLDSERHFLQVSKFADPCCSNSNFLWYFRTWSSNSSTFWSRYPRKVRSTTKSSATASDSSSSSSTLKLFCQLVGSSTPFWTILTLSCAASSRRWWNVRKENYSLRWVRQTENKSNTRENFVNKYKFFYSLR